MLCLFAPANLQAQDVYAAYRASWLQKAQANIPVLNTTPKKPVGLVKLVSSTAAFQGWKAEPTISVDSFYKHSFFKQKEVILDFGEHITGYFSFKITPSGRTPDAPVRLKITFGEVPSEIATPFEPYKGTLNRAWLQDETVDIMELPATVKISRRVAFRYVKIEVAGTAGLFDFTISGVNADAVSSVNSTPAALAAQTPEDFKQIDRVGLNTLKECMQTVYEDGPKRDRRLWAGDLYLESLANDYSFKNYALTKRCLYLLAALSDNDGTLNATVFERPEPHAQSRQFLLDYCFLYIAGLKNYVATTGDTATGQDLWPIAKKQLYIVNKYLLPSGLMDYEKANREWWIFFDWKDGLDKQASLQGISVFALQQTYALAKLLHKEGELSDIPATIAKMKAAGKASLYNTQTGMVVSGTQRQLSYASQIWFTMSGILSPKEAGRALRTVAQTPAAVYPGSPYLYHYYVQALIDAGLNDMAKSTIRNYWGGMVKKGADTFWEVYDPNNEYLSPYNFFPVNSYCHAWSCTPVYFIRKYPRIFQQ